jgi:uncharacterized integral membrane protein
VSSTPGPESNQPVSPTPAAPTDSRTFTEKAHETASNTYRILRLVVFAAVAVIATLFVLRNWNDVNVDFVFGDVDVPLALVMIGGVVVGAVLALLGRWLWFRD